VRGRLARSAVQAERQLVEERRRAEERAALERKRAANLARREALRAKRQQAAELAAAAAAKKEEQELEQKREREGGAAAGAPAAPPASPPRQLAAVGVDESGGGGAQRRARGGGAAGAWHSAPRSQIGPRAAEQRLREIYDVSVITTLGTSAHSPVPPLPAPLVLSEPRRHGDDITQEHQPAKVRHIPALLRKWSGREAELVAKVETKYLGIRHSPPPPRTLAAAAAAAAANGSPSRLPVPRHPKQFPATTQKARHAKSSHPRAHSPPAWDFPTGTPDLLPQAVCLCCTPDILL
jgi:hypothetical protein